MGAFKLCLLFAAVLLMLNLQNPANPGKLEKTELVNNGIVHRSGILVLPTLLKWDAPLTSLDRSGVIVLRVKEMRFTYTQNGSTRNEYKLSKAAPQEIGVVKGDRVEVDFSQSFLGFEDKIDAFVRVGAM